MSEKNLKGVPTNLFLSITKSACCSHLTQLSIDDFFLPLVMVGGTYMVYVYVCIFTAFTVGWPVSGSDCPALVYSFGPGYGQWQWLSGLQFLSLQVMACGRSHIGPFWFLAGFWFWRRPAGLFLCILPCYHG